MLYSSLSYHSNPKNKEHEDFVQRTSDNLLADQSQYVRRVKSAVFRSMAFENQNSTRLLWFEFGHLAERLRFAAAPVRDYGCRSRAASWTMTERSPDRHPLALRAAATSRPPGRIRGRAVPTVTICSPSASFGGVSKSRHRPTCREWPQRSPNRQFVNRPTLAEVPLTGLPFHSLISD